MAQTLENQKVNAEALKVVWATLFRLYPPTNPAVLLRAMRSWYLVYGNGPVLKAMTDWLIQVIGLETIPMNSIDQYNAAQADFTEKTGLDKNSDLNGSTDDGSER